MKDPETKIHDLALEIRDLLKSKKLRKSPVVTQEDGSRVWVQANKEKSELNAKGMFLVMPRKWFDLTHQTGLLTDFQRRVVSVLTKKRGNLCEINRPTDLRREDFEVYTSNVLRGAGFDVVPARACIDEVPGEYEQNWYDFTVVDKPSSKKLTLEVKSDRNYHTGNVAVELLRDFDLDYERNVGSLSKTRADLWVVYFFDENRCLFDAEVYLRKQLQEKAIQYVKIIRDLLDENPP
jgi:hypothetical protein